MCLMFPDSQALGLGGRVSSPYIPDYMEPNGINSSHILRRLAHDRPVCR
jgi:hypothetical protein